MSVFAPEVICGLERTIGYTFSDRKVLFEALTHKSYHYETPANVYGFNERLEFLGDSVLALVVVEYLFGLGGTLTEAEMSKIKSYVVKGRVLYETAREISLGQYIRIGKGEEGTGGRRRESILSNAFEALIGAIYLDGGFDAARDFILARLGKRVGEALRSGDFHDYKTELQERTQVAFEGPPDYRIVAEEGKDHERVFTAEVYVGGVLRGTGKGLSKKEAQVSAAKVALINIVI